MRKLVLTTALLSCFDLFGMEKTPLEKFNDYVSEWSEELTAPFSSERKRKNWSELTTKPFKEKLCAEIGEDSFALQGLDLFYLRKFPEFLEHWETNRESMLPSNAEKFRELLILLAPMMDLVEENEQYVKRIIGIAGKIENVVSYRTRFPQFSYEMFFCVTLEANNELDAVEKSRKYCGLYLQASEETCRHIASHFDWPHKKEELSLLRITGYYEDEIGVDDDRLWDAVHYPDNGDCKFISQRLFGDDDH
jgi:hypothetical protein